MDDILNEINDENLQKNFANENSENNYSNNNNNNYQNNEQHIRNYNVRYNAVKILNRYERSDSYVDKLLDFAFVNNDFNKFDKALLTEIVNGVIRWRAKLDWILTGFYNGDYLKCLNWVKNAMRVGLYQLLFLTKIPPAIAIYETVEMTKKNTRRKNSWACQCCSKEYPAQYREHTLSRKRRRSTLLSCYTVFVSKMVGKALD